MTDEFEIVEATINEIHEAMKAGTLTSEELVRRYFRRIEAYDQDGPELNSITTLNDEAVERAAELDEILETDGMVGPLHGIPVLVKDQAETAGITTTFGSEACTDYIPETDATIVTHLKEAGAVITAKTNLPDWASAYFGYSSAAGQTKNPYDPSRDPGGSSAGSGAGVAANLGTIGIAEDTGGSVRVPAANCNLFGIRVTTGLISRTGFSPIVPRQDTPGPVARTMTDMTRLLDVLVGYDDEDSWTGAVSQSHVDSYMNYLNDDGLEGKRLGVLRDALGEEDPNAEPVNRTFESALESLVEAGAELVDPVSIPDLDAQVEDTTIYGYHATIHLNAFLEARDGIPYDSIRELYEAGAYHEGLDLIQDIAETTDDPESELDYWRSTLDQESFRRDVLETFAVNDLDAIVFPDVQVVPPRISELGERYTTANFPTNTPIGAQTQCPAISMPGELTEEGLPVGIELLGTSYDEHRLVEMAYAYEQVTATRESPNTAPPLSSD